MTRRAAPPTNQRNHDALLRINYLYQLAHYTHTTQNTALQRNYTKQVKQLSQRIVHRLHSNIKNTICKRCNVLLVNRYADDTIIEYSDRVLVRRECTVCGYSKLIDTRPDISAASTTVTQSEPGTATTE